MRIYGDEDLIYPDVQVSRVVYHTAMFAPMCVYTRLDFRSNCHCEGALGELLSRALFFCRRLRSTHAVALRYSR